MALLGKRARSAPGDYSMESRDHQVRRHQPPSPSQCQSRGGKAAPSPKKEEREGSVNEDEPAVKRQKQDHNDTTSADDPLSNPTLHWIINGHWPSAALGQIPSSMSALASTAKRKSPSPHRSEVLERLAANGVFMQSRAELQQSSKDICKSYTRRSRDMPKYTSIPSDQFIHLLRRVAASNEARIRRDVTPWIVPSAETLHIRGELEHDYIGDAVDVLWSRCVTMGSTCPKPDYCAGLLPCAYTPSELAALREYASPQKPVFFTPELSFPFLMCEVKAGEVDLAQADRQNIHSASIAVRAIVELYKTVFGEREPALVTDLYGQVLAFSVSHNHDRVQIYGHFCALKGAAGDDLEFYRYPVACILLNFGDGEDRGRVYSFTRNLYDHFAPEHLRRIKRAAEKLPQARTHTRSPSLATREPEPNPSGDDSQEILASDAAVEFRMPGTPASTIESRQVRMLTEQMEQQKRHYQHQFEQLKAQMEQQMERRSESQAESESRKVRLITEQMEQQMEQQKRDQQQEIEQLKAQMEQMMEQMIDDRRLREATGRR